MLQDKQAEESRKEGAIGGVMRRARLRGQQKGADNYGAAPPPSARMRVDMGLGGV
jgi:hypothetical protein